MKILLDTHIFLWAAGSTGKLSYETLDLLANPETEKFLSAASVWEIAIKYGKGQLPLPEHPRRFIPLTLASSNIVSMSVTFSDTLGVADLPRHHGDPFDRLLIAQAKLHDMYLLTDDRIFERYDVDIIDA
jgi:PIN domain nuclease of toxin-antitoxin system